MAKLLGLLGWRGTLVVIALAAAVVFALAHGTATGGTVAAKHGGYSYDQPKGWDHRSPCGEGSCGCGSADRAVLQHFAQAQQVRSFVDIKPGIKQVNAQTMPRIIEFLKDAARHLSMQLGYRPPRRASVSI